MSRDQTTERILLLIRQTCSQLLNRSLFFAFVCKYGVVCTALIKKAWRCRPNHRRQSIQHQTTNQPKKQHYDLTQFRSLSNQQFIQWITTHAVETIATEIVARNRAPAPAPQVADVNITTTAIPTDTSAVTDTITTAIIAIATTTAAVTMTKTKAVANEIQLQLQRQSPSHLRAVSSRGATYRSTSLCSPCTWISKRGSG